MHTVKFLVLFFFCHRAAVDVKTVAQTLLAEDLLLVGIITFPYVTVAINSVTRVSFAHCVGRPTGSLLMLLWFSVYRVRSGFMPAVITLTRMNTKG